MIRDETVDPTERFVSLAQPRDRCFMNGVGVVVVAGADQDLGIRVGSALRLVSGPGAGTTVLVVEARDALEGLGQSLRQGALAAEELRAVSEPPKPGRPDIYYVPPFKAKQKAQWKQERARARRR